jgi:ABC-type transport system substrate-binding protein
MSETRISNLVSKMHDAELSRREVLKKSGVAALSASALSMLLTGRTFAAPGSSTPRYLVDKIDASTLVVTDALSGAYWLGLDPAWYYEINPTMAMFAIYDQLYAGQDGSDPTNIQPLLADGMPILSDDLLTATIKLRQGIKFQNTGNEMTADDVIFSYKRLAATYAQSSFLATDYWTDIQKTDDYTITLTLAAPNSGLAAVLASIPLSITDSKQVIEFGGNTDRPEFTDTTTDDEKANNESILANKDAQNLINSTSVGTGPFKVDQWDTNSSVILIANPDYWGEAPKIEQIIFTNIVDANAQLQAVETGDADIAYSLNPDSVASVEQNPDLQIISGSSLSIQYLAMNLNEKFGGPMANQQARQAFAYAIDYESILNDVLVGGAVRPALPIPLPLPGNDRVGKYRAGEFQTTISPWSPDYPDVDTYATPFFQTDTAAAKRVSYSNPDVDALLKQGLAETDPDKRAAIYLQIQELVLPDIPYIVLYQPVYRKPATIKVEGVTVHPIYMMNLREASKTE